MIFWFVGFVLAVISACFVWEEVEIDPYSSVSSLLPAVCGFAVFPVLNFVVAFIMVADSREKRKARKEGKIK